MTARAQKFGYLELKDLFLSRLTEEQIWKSNYGRVVIAISDSPIVFCYPTTRDFFDGFNTGIRTQIFDTVFQKILIFNCRKIPLKTKRIKT